MIRKDGFNFSFEPNKCDECGGKCCVGSSGYIWVSHSDIQNMSKLLDISTGNFTDTYLIKYGNKYSIKERKVKDEYECIFFDLGKCKIYNSRPAQCIKFPFWDDFKGKSKFELTYLQDECIGVDFDEDAKLPNN